jgi:hypothetical protein
MLDGPSPNIKGTTKKTEPNEKRKEKEKLTFEK